MTARVESNIERVRQSVKDTQGHYVLRTRALARKMGAAARDNVKANISKPTFPGYAITGALAKKVVSSEPVQEGGGWTARVRVQLTGKQAKYALIHETGGYIKIKSAAQIRAMFANLRKYGQVRSGGSGGKLSRIHIRKKAYFAKGIDKTRREWSITRLKKEF